jgi:EmrB/QacA subfamily drug resistance transporter
MTAQSTTKWWTLGLVSVATFMLLLDITVVNTALPAIDAYTLTLAAVVLTAGSLADRLGRRRVFAAGLALFSVASLVAGLAPDPTFLNIARGVQGIGGAAMFAVSLALIAQEFPAGRERGMAMGVYGATIGLAVAFGPLVGGAIVDGLGWEWIFFLNVPIGIAAVYLSLRQVRETRDPNARQVDWVGTVTFSGALLCLVLALLRGNDEGWDSTIILLLFAGAAVLMLAFFIAQARVREPMLPLSLFRIPSFTGVQLGAFAIAGSQFALFLYLTLYLQNILGYSPLEAGVRYLPLTVVSFFVAPLSGQVMHRIQPRFLIGGGLLLAGVGLILMSGVEEGDTWTTLLPGFLLGGIGIGMLNPPTAAVSVSVVERAQSGMAAGINNTFRQVGISVGIAAYGAIFLDRASSEIAERAPGTDSHGLSEAVSSGNLPAGPENVVHAAREGFFAGFNEILLIGAGLAIAGAIAAVLLVRPQDMRSDVPAPAPAA